MQMTFKLSPILLFIFILPKATFSNCENCAKCDENEYCSECLPGFGFRYYSDNNYCSPCNEKCKHCRDYQYFDCTECYDGYYFEPQTGLDYGYCYQCKSELCAQCELKSGVYKCLQCKPGYYLDDNNDCQKCYDTCLTCKGTGAAQCLTCQDGFFDESSGTQELHECVSCAPLCRECHGAKIEDCDVCEDGYYKTNNECRTCDINCLTCVNERTHCLSCHEGFYLEKETNKCQPCSEHCSKCEGPNEDQCTDCFEGYVEKDGYCRDCPSETYYKCPKCKKTKDGIKCTQCPPGYGLSEDYDGDAETFDCYPCSNGNCYSCPISSYSCERCNEHYYLVSKEQCDECEFPCKDCTD